jgi:hypothetical protein
MAALGNRNVEPDVRTYRLVAAWAQNSEGWPRWMAAFGANSQTLKAMKLLMNGTNKACFGQ